MCTVDNSPRAYICRSRGFPRSNRRIIMHNAYQQIPTCSSSASLARASAARTAASRSAHARLANPLVVAPHSRLQRTKRSGSQPLPRLSFRRPCAGGPLPPQRVPRRVPRQRPTTGGCARTPAPRLASAASLRRPRNPTGPEELFAGTPATSGAAAASRCAVSPI